MKFINIKEFRNNIRFNTLIFLAFITCLVLVYSTYAWFSSTLDVKITNFRAVVDPETGLYISLDGINWGSTVDISEASIITNLKNNYPSHTNQWSDAITSTSTVGLQNTNQSKFTMFGNKKPMLPRFSFLNTDKIDIIKLDESKSNNDAEFIAFDIFLRNLTTSPYSDNLYLIDGTRVVNSSEEMDDTAANAIRIGFVFMGGGLDRNASPNESQHLTCRPTCTQYIYEPNSTIHNENSVEILGKHGVTLTPGVHYPTYAVYREKNRVQMWAGVDNSGIPFDNTVFRRQNTSTRLNEPIGQIPSGITKVRVYIWVEAQDIDIIEQVSTGYEVAVVLNFEKDMAGYE